ncbi:type II secretion system F family protein (plasmid) [Vallitalea pronyensis]|uniref:Type II secretion system F family protein n=1 Tax=Vallitalea pronyensis TaxID=1348613 RepID=A0A8J8MQS0_9FIRM|nr:type II secretion system F family protein [Vallitalea pronyensis]QUI25909.1 type II secretion system F family protein [Vallitalea pronyensis]
MLNELIELYAIATLSWPIFILFIIILVTTILIVGIVTLKLPIGSTLSTTVKSIKGGFKKLDRKANRNLIRIVQSQMKDDYTLKLNFLENMDLTLVQRSNIKKYVPFVNIYTLLILQGIIFVNIFPRVYSIFHSVITAILIGVLICFLPVAILDGMGRYNSNRIRLLTTDFLSVLHSFLEIRSDLLYAMEKSIDNIPEPLKSFVIECVVQIKNGVDIEVALDLLSYKVNIRQFYSVVLNLKQAVKSKGDVLELVRRLEDEAFMLEEEFDNRKMKSWSDRILVNIIMVIAILVVYYCVQLNATLRTLYLGTTEGRIILNVSSLLFAIGFYFNLKIEKFNH